MNYCNRCRKYISYGVTCFCKKYELRIEDYHDLNDFKEVWALSEEKAASELSKDKYYNNNIHDFYHDHEVEDIVINKAGKSYIVELEVDVWFRARELV